jgi:hypothetical protein
LIDYSASEQGIAINSSPYEDKAHPSVAFDGAKYIIVWTYLTFSNYTPAGIYYATVSTAGVLDGSPDGAGLSLSGPPPSSSRFAYPVICSCGAISSVAWANVSEVMGTAKDIRGILQAANVTGKSVPHENSLSPSRKEAALRE